MQLIMSSSSDAGSGTLDDALLNGLAVVSIALPAVWPKWTRQVTY